MTCVSIHEETDLLASGSRDGSLQLCDLSSGTNVACLLLEFPMAGNILQYSSNACGLFQLRDPGVPEVVFLEDLVLSWRCLVLLVRRVQR